MKTQGLKAMAKALRTALAHRTIDISHRECLELIAKQFNMKDWNALAALVGADAADKPLTLTVAGEDIKLHRTTERLDVNDTDLSGSRFNDANLTSTSFNQIAFSGATFNDSNMTGWFVNDVNLAGSRFQNINLSGVAFTQCRLAGATLDGIPLEDLVAAYRAAQSG